MPERFSEYDPYWGDFKPSLREVFEAMTWDETEIGYNADWVKRILETASKDQIAIVNAAIRKSVNDSEVAWELGFYDY